MKRIILPLIAIGLLLSGCVYPNQKISLWQMAPTLQYRGFSIKRPTDKRWYVNAGEQVPTSAMWRMDLESPTHTMFTALHLEKIAIEPSSHDELEGYVKKMFTATSPRNELLDYKSHQSTLQEQWCVNFEVTTRDLAAMNSDEPLIMTMRGFVVLHPNWPRTVVSAYVSQRGKAEELSPELDVTGKELLNDVTLESAPGESL